MPEEKHVFGGEWTTEKLNILQKYLQAYVTVMKKQRFTLYYIDAFAGTGYRDEKIDDKIMDWEYLSLFPEMAENDSRQFLEGSARLALQVKPPFDHYIFVEINPSRCAELELLKEEFPQLSDRINIINEDANLYLRKLCYNKNWKREWARGVLFLDPYAMQVEWDTIKAIASTEVFDLWYLFPVMAVNRLLKKDGKITEANKKRLDRIFGTPHWKEAFYRRDYQSSILEFLDDKSVEVRSVKAADIRDLKRFIIGRLEEVFPGVAKNPRVLYNSKNSPLFLFCFAVSTRSTKGIAVALRIAQAILGKQRGS